MALLLASFLISMRLLTAPYSPFLSIPGRGALFAAFVTLPGLLIAGLMAPIAMSHKRQRLQLHVRQPRLLVGFLLLGVLLHSSDAMQTETDRDAFRLTIFDGIRSHYQAWRWAFIRYLMAKYPHLVPVLEGTVVAPALLTLAAALSARRLAAAGTTAEPVATRTRSNSGSLSNPSDAADPLPLAGMGEADLEARAQRDVDANTELRDKITQWLMQLFGILTSAMPPHLTSTLFINCYGDGRAAYLRLQQRFGSADRNHAVKERAQVLRNVVDDDRHPPEPSSTWVQHLFDHMNYHITEMLSAGGAPIDDDTLMAHFVSCLPYDIYQHVTTYVLDQSPTTLEEMFELYMERVLFLESSADLARARGGGTRRQGAFAGWLGGQPPPPSP